MLFGRFVWPFLPLESSQSDVRFLFVLSLPDFTTSRCWSFLKLLIDRVADIMRFFDVQVQVGLYNKMKAVDTFEGRLSRVG